MQPLCSVHCTAVEFRRTLWHNGDSGGVDVVGRGFNCSEVVLFFEVVLNF